VLAGEKDPVLLLTTLVVEHPGVTVTVLLTPDRCASHLPKASPADAV